MHKTDCTTWRIARALRSGFVEIWRPKDRNTPCRTWPYARGKSKLYRVEDVSRKPFDEDLDANIHLEDEYLARIRNGDYDRDMLPTYTSADQAHNEAARGTSIERPNRIWRGNDSRRRMESTLRRHQREAGGSTDTLPRYSTLDNGGGDNFADSSRIGGFRFSSAARWPHRESSLGLSDIICLRRPEGVPSRGSEGSGRGLPREGRAALYSHSGAGRMRPSRHAEYDDHEREFDRRRC